MKRIIDFLSLCVLVSLISLPIFAQDITTIAEINQVNEEGNPTFPGLQTMDRYTIEGLALNDSDIYNALTDTGEMEQSFIVFLLDETGGIQVYSGSWYGGGLALHPEVKQGDRIRVTGLTGHYGGKTNMNDRHNPDQKFDVTVLSSGNSLPLIEIENLAGIGDFDYTRQTGGEYYQGRLVVLKNVQIVEGEWAPGEIVTVQDPLGNTFPVQLYYGTHIGDSPKPEGLLDITGIFDQEDPEAPFTEGYLLWPRSIADFQPAGGSSAVDVWDVYN